MKGVEHERMDFGGGYSGSCRMGSVDNFSVCNMSFRRVFNLKEYRVMFVWETVVYALTFFIGLLAGLVWGGALI